jgi:hypothetical protein
LRRPLPNQIMNVSAEEGCQPNKFVRLHATFTFLHRYDRRARHANRLCNFLLRETPRLPCLLNPRAQNGRSQRPIRLKLHVSPLLNVATSHAFPGVPSRT